MPGIFWVVPIAAAITVLFAVWLVVTTLRRSPGTPEMKKVGDMIYEGAWAFLKRQYSTIGYVIHLRRHYYCSHRRGPAGKSGNQSFSLRLCLEDGHRLPGGRDLLRRGGIHRHDHCRQIQLPHRRGFAEEPE